MKQNMQQKTNSGSQPIHSTPVTTISSPSASSIGSASHASPSQQRLTSTQKRTPEMSSSELPTVSTDSGLIRANTSNAEAGPSTADTPSQAEMLFGNLDQQSSIGDLPADFGRLSELAAGSETNEDAVMDALAGTPSDQFALTTEQDISESSSQSAVPAASSDQPAVLIEHSGSAPASMSGDFLDQIVLTVEQSGSPPASTSGGPPDQPALTTGQSASSPLNQPGGESISTPLNQPGGQNVPAPADNSAGGFPPTDPPATTGAPASYPIQSQPESQLPSGSDPPPDPPSMSENTPNNSNNSSEGHVWWGIHYVLHNHKISVGIKGTLNSRGPFISLSTKFEPALNHYSYALRPGFGKHVEVGLRISSFEGSFEFGKTGIFSYRILSGTFNPAVENFAHRIAVLGKTLHGVETLGKHCFPNTLVRFNVINELGLSQAKFFTTSTPIQKTSFSSHLPLLGFLNNRIGAELTGGLQFAKNSNSKVLYQPTYSIHPITGHEKIHVEDLLKRVHKQLNGQSDDIRDINISIQDLKKNNADYFNNVIKQGENQDSSLKEINSLIEDDIAVSKADLENTDKLLHNQNCLDQQLNNVVKECEFIKTTQQNELETLETMSETVKTIPNQIVTTCGSPEEYSFNDTFENDLEEIDLSKLPLGQIAKCLSGIILIDIIKGSIIGVISAGAGVAIYHVVSMSLRECKQKNLNNTILFQVLSIVRLFLSPFFFSSFILAIINITYNILARKNIYAKFFIYQFQMFPDDKIIFSDKNTFFIRIALSSAPLLLTKTATSLPLIYLFKRTVYTWIKQRSPVVACVAHVVSIVFFIIGASILATYHERWLHKNVREHEKEIHNENSYPKQLM